MDPMTTLLQTAPRHQERRLDHARSADCVQRSRSLRSNPFARRNLRGSPEGSCWLPIKTPNANRPRYAIPSPRDTPRMGRRGGVEARSSIPTWWLSGRREPRVGCRFSPEQGTRSHQGTGPTPTRVPGPPRWGERVGPTALADVSLPDDLREIYRGSACTSPLSTAATPGCFHSLLGSLWTDAG